MKLYKNKETGTYWNYQGNICVSKVWFPTIPNYNLYAIYSLHFAENAFEHTFATFQEYGNSIRECEKKIDKIYKKKDNK